MTIEKIKYSTHNLKFIKPFKSSKGEISFRPIILIEAEIDSGHIVSGEIAPLEGFSSESFDEALDETISLCSSFHSADINGLSSILHSVKNPSVKFGFEQLSAGLRELKDGTEKTGLNVKINYLFTLAELLNLNLKKYRGSVLKVKLGIESGNEEIRKLNGLSAALEDENIILRLDVNCGWSLDNARRLIHQIKPDNIEYIEQPVADTSQLIQLAGDSPIPIAADESLYQPDSLDEILNSEIEHLIIKPGIFGGLVPIKKLISDKFPGKKITISSALESNLGWNYLLFIADKIAPERTHGLSLFNLFTHQPRDIKFEFKNHSVKSIHPQNIGIKL